MTSWKRGRRNEHKGDSMMGSPEVGEKVKGAALKAAGIVEQGLDNVKDRITGEQNDLRGRERTPESHAGSHAGSSHNHQAKASSGAHSHANETSHTSHEKKSGGSSASHRSAKSK